MKCIRCVVALFCAFLCLAASAPPAPPITLDELKEMRWISYADNWWPVSFCPRNRDYHCIDRLDDSVSWQGNWVSYEGRTATLTVDEAWCQVFPDAVPTMRAPQRVIFIFSRKEGFLHARVSGGSWGEVEAWLRP